MKFSKRMYEKYLLKQERSAPSNDQRRLDTSITLYRLEEELKYRATEASELRNITRE